MPPGILATDARGNIVYSSSFAAPPFPVRFLRGIPMFWDDFESGPAGFIMPERALAYQTVTAGPRALSSGRWNFRDGNEYGVYITADAGASGKRSLFLGGNPTNQTYGDVGNQDASVDVHVPSGIVGVEMSLLFKTGIEPGGHLISIEDKTPGNSAQYRELQLQINPFSTFGSIYTLKSTGTVKIGGFDVADSLGQLLAGITGPYKGAGTDFARGSTGAWHRTAFVVDMNVGKLIAAFFDKFFYDLRGQGTGVWKISNPNATVATLQDGLKRIELHSLTVGTSFAPEIYHDDIVVTDEAGQTYP